MKDDLIPYINDVDTLVNEFNELYQNRLFKKQQAKSVNRKRIALSVTQREKIFEKTEGFCHVCGCLLEFDKFEADHVRQHAQGGSDVTDNFLPSCSKCNSYRWNYSSEEIQWILKLGVWLKTKIQSREQIGLKTAIEFLLDETTRENRRSTPRNPKSPFEITSQNLFPIKGKNKAGHIEASFDEIAKARQIITKFQFKNDNAITENFFLDKTFLITGESNLSRGEMEFLITKNKGIIKQSVTKSLDFIVIGNFYGLLKIYEVDKFNNEKGASIKILTHSALIKYIY